MSDAVLVKAPEGTPRKYGIESHLSWDPAGAERWVNGIQVEGIPWDAAAIGNSSAFLQEWEGTANEEKTIDVYAPVYVPRSAKTVYRYVKTSTGTRTADEHRKKVTDEFEAQAQRYYENEFYVGWGSNTGIATDGEVLTGGASSTWPTLAGAVALLEQAWYSHTDIVPTLHIPRFAANYFEACVAELLVDIDGRLFTKFGTKVVLGAGYTNLKDSGASTDAGFISLHLTGDLFGIRTTAIKPLVGEDSYVPDTNDVIEQVEQTFVIAHNGPQSYTAYGEVC